MAETVWGQLHSLPRFTAVHSLATLPDLSQAGSEKRRLGKGTWSYEANVFAHALFMILFLEIPLVLPQRLYTEATPMLAMPCLHMTTCDSPFQPHRPLHPSRRPSRERSLEKAQAC